MKYLKKIYDFAAEVIDEWNSDKAAMLAAALAYYAVFSVGPMLLIVIWVSGLAFGEVAVQGRVVEEISGLVGQQGPNLSRISLEMPANPPVTPLPVSLVLRHSSSLRRPSFATYKRPLTSSGMWKHPPVTAESCMMSSTLYRIAFSRLQWCWVSAFC